MPLTDDDKTFLIRVLAMHAALSTAFSMADSPFEAAEGYVAAIRLFVSGAENYRAAVAKALEQPPRADAASQTPSQQPRSTEGAR